MPARPPLYCGHEGPPHGEPDRRSATAACFEGVMSPHATIFTREPDRGTPAGDERFTIGTAYTRDLLPEEFGTAIHARVAAEGARAAIDAAGIDATEDVHFVQIKTGALTTERINEARARGRSVVTGDTYKSMTYGRAAAALGIGLATGEVAPSALDADVIARDFSVLSDVASTSSGVELMNCEIIVLGNSRRSTSDLLMSHAVMRDAIDAAGVREALRRAGLSVDCELAPFDRGRLVNVFAKCEPDASGQTRGRRHVMFDDSDINDTRHIRGVVNAVIASVIGDTMCYVSAGAEHQGPPGGGVVAVLARARRTPSATCEDHVGRAPHREEPPRAIADPRLAEGDGTPSLQDPSLSDEVALAGTPEEAHVEVERGLTDTALRGIVERAEGAPHRGIHKRAVDAAVNGRARRIAQLVAHGHTETHPPGAGVVHLDAQVTPEQVVARPGAHPRQEIVAHALAGAQTACGMSGCTASSRVRSGRAR
jgi:cyanuric acid amidohydrolase